jgi:hypothetical protein
MARNRLQSLEWELSAVAAPTYDPVQSEMENLRRRLEAVRRRENTVSE